MLGLIDTVDKALSYPIQILNISVFAHVLFLPGCWMEFLSVVSTIGPLGILTKLLKKYGVSCILEILELSHYIPNLAKSTLNFVFLVSNSLKFF